MQGSLHYFLHLIAPVFLALLFFRKDWKRAYLIMLATMLVDLDHVLASPMFQPDRCSIQFHPLHTYYAMAVYAMLLFFKRPLNIIGLGLLFHMFTDLVDCIWMYGECLDCLKDAPAKGLLESIIGLSSSLP